MGAIVITAVVFGLFKIARDAPAAAPVAHRILAGDGGPVGCADLRYAAGRLYWRVALSLLWLIWRSSHPAIPVLGKTPDETAYYSIENHPEPATFPGIVIIRFDGPLFFATASSLRNRVRELTREVDPPVKALILDMESTISSTWKGRMEIARDRKRIERARHRFLYCQAKKAIMEIMEKDGVLEEIPASNFFTSVEAALKRRSRPEEYP